MDNFGSRLKALRTKQGLLMRQVAAATDGDRLPTRKQIEKLALILKVTEEELLVQAYSEKIAYDLIKEPLAEEIVELALKKLQLKK